MQRIVFIFTVSICLALSSCYTPTLEVVEEESWDFAEPIEEDMDWLEEDLVYDDGSDFLYEDDDLFADDEFDEFLDFEEFDEEDFADFDEIDMEMEMDMVDMEDQMMPADMDSDLSRKRGIFEQYVGNVVNFDFNASNIRYDAAEQLERMASWLVENPGLQMVVAGHCDVRGTREYNLALGSRRANSVKSFLVALGVNQNNISTVSYGKERPIAFGNSEADHAVNRRAEVMIMSSN